MKWFKIAFIILGITTSVFASSSFEKMESYKEIQRLVKIEDKRDEALRMISVLMSKLDESDSLYRDLRDLKNSLSGHQSAFPLDKAIKFGTGTKNEIYCKGVGLVYIKSKHNDGTISELKLISSNREMLNGSYSVIKKGDWVYELVTAYRSPTLSDSWLDNSSLNSYSIREVRSSNNDSGKWTAEWKEKSHTHNYSTRGDTPEPLPMHLGNDYHLWGEYDLGFQLKFKEGYKDTISGRETGSSKAIILKTKREVLKERNQFSYEDSKGKKHTHSSCFEVVAQVSLDKLVDAK